MSKEERGSITLSSNLPLRVVATCYERDRRPPTATSAERPPVNSRVAATINSRGGPPVAGNILGPLLEVGVAEALET